VREVKKQTGVLWGGGGLNCRVMVGYLLSLAVIIYR